MSVMNFSYTGAVQTATLQAGTYLLECWGAQGGDSNVESGGNGGYSKGILSLSSAKQIFIYIGGTGTYSSTSGSFVAGGFNGGGAAGAIYGGSGGGGTDIRIGQDSLYARVIVAGGGGGAWGYSGFVGGVGGGTNGGDGTGYSGSADSVCGKGGTATTGGASATYGGRDGGAGAFGVGGDANTYNSTRNRSSGGGGGWYGGGGTVFRDHSSRYYWGGGGAGGGSGFVWQGENAPSGYLLGSEYYLTDAQTIAGSETFTSPTGTSETGHAGNGYARITSLKPNPPSNLTETHDYFSVTLKWTAASGASGYKVYINNTQKATTSATTYTVYGLDAETQYTAKVVAYATNGDSDPVETTFRTTSANLRQTAKDYRTITLAWDSASSMGGYWLYRNGTLVESLSQLYTTYTDTGLYPSESYTYQLKSYRDSDIGMSGTVIGKTEEAVYEQKPVFHSIVISPNPTNINTQITITVNVTDEFIIFEPEKFYSGELYSNEV